MDTAAYWFRRDLRLEDNKGLFMALSCGLPLVPVFILDPAITDELEANDPRISFIYDQLESINDKLRPFKTSLVLKKGDPVQVWSQLIVEHNIVSIYANHDYEPYARERDKRMYDICHERGVLFKTFKDQVIFEKNEILKADGSPYKVFTAYKNKWLSGLSHADLELSDSFSLLHNLKPLEGSFPELGSMGFHYSHIKVKTPDLEVISEYHETRDFPGEDQGTYLGPHLRFGTVSIRKIVELASKTNAVFLDELIWREFFMQILFHFPEVVTRSFKTPYENIPWENNIEYYERWCRGETGYPMVDAGMRELNKTGYMHNRVRMIAASFLVKHLLVDWRWGEAYFAEKLLDYELSSNNGNWQWVAGCGCDAAPYFRIFNPESQQKKFDPEFKYIRKWVGEFGTSSYPGPILTHDFARDRTIKLFRDALKR